MDNSNFPALRGDALDPQWYEGMWPGEAMEVFSELTTEELRELHSNTVEYAKAFPERQMLSLCDAIRTELFERGEL